MSSLLAEQQQAVARGLWTQILCTVQAGRNGIRDVIISSLPQVVRLGAGMAASVLIARGLGPSVLGNYALVLSVSALIAGLSDMGIGQTAIRYASLAVSRGNRDEQFAVLRWAFRLRMLLVLAVITLAYFLAPVIATRAWDQPELVPLIRLSLLVGVFSAVAAVPVIYFQSLKRFGMNAFVWIVQALINLVGIALLALWNKWTVGQVVAVSVISTALGAGAMLFLVPRGILIGGSRHAGGFLQRVRALLRNPVSRSSQLNAYSPESPNTFAFYMFLSSVVCLVMLQMDVWLMGHYLAKEAVGKYYVAYRFMLPLTVFLQAMNTAMWPRTSSLQTPGEIAGLAKRTLRLTVISLVPLVLYSIFAPMVAPLVFGSDYSGVVFLSQLLCLRFCLSILINPLTLIGYSLGLVRLYCVMNVVNLVVLVGVEVVFLGRIGAFAPVLARTVTTVTSVLILLPPTIKFYRHHWKKAV